jgi:hypothetical protein
MVSRALVVLAVLCASLRGVGHAATSVTQSGVTFTFSADVTCGQYVTGDWWCVAPVTINSISPDAASGANGWMVNPTTGAHAWDSRVAGYNGSLMPALPYTAAADQSIAKAVSHVGACSFSGPTCIDDVVVLTVVASAPTATAFRPGYFGTTKTSFDSASLRTDRLPALASVAGAPSLATAEGFMRGVCADHYDCCSGTRAGKPNNACPNYGTDQGRELSDAVLRTFLDEQPQAKRPLVELIVQRGIDLYAMYQGGRTWTESGGQGYGRKLAIAYAGWLLDDAGMKQAAGYPGSPSDASFSEDFMTYVSPQADSTGSYGGAAGEVLFGKDKSECQYWGCPGGHGCPASCTTGYNSDDRDPYGYIDASAYIKNGAAYKGFALAQHLVPALKTIAGFEPLLIFTERYVELGLWRAPDPCALTPPATFNGTCSAGGPRFPGEHGTQKDDWGVASSGFQDAMWTAYLTCAKSCTCAGQICTPDPTMIDAGNVGGDDFPTKPRADDGCGCSGGGPGSLALLAAFAATAAARTSRSRRRRRPS